MSWQCRAAVCVLLLALKLWQAVLSFHGFFHISKIIILDIKKTISDIRNCILDVQNSLTVILDI